MLKGSLTFKTCNYIASLHGRTSWPRATQQRLLQVVRALVQPRRAPSLPRRC
jgi:hypothetical protein